MKWIIDEQKLRDADGPLISPVFKTSIPGVSYHFELNPKQETSVCLFLCIQTNGLSICADYTYSIGSFKKSVQWRDGSGFTMCSRSDFFNPQKNYIVAGKMILKLEGTLKAVSLKRKATTEVYTLGELLSEREDKDFVVAVGEDEIKVSYLYYNMFVSLLLNFHFLGS